MKKTNVKRISIIMIIIISLISVSAIIYATTTIQNPTTITFEDRNLYDSIKKQLSAKKIAYNCNDVENSIEVSTNDVEKVTELDLSTSTITNLSGLENFSNLNSLNLSQNMITTASPLTQLTKLEKLNMTENAINTEILTTISNLTTLRELNMTNTKMNGDQLEYFKNLTNLNVLILASNNISAIGKISNLTELNKLDISVNTSFTDFLQLTSFVNLTELNVSGTGITTFSGAKQGEGIEKLEKLEKLYASDIKGITSVRGIEAIYRTVYRDNVREAYLKNLKFLNLSSMGIKGSRPSINFSDMIYLTNLEELHLASNEINNVSGIINLASLKVLDLRDNNISSISNLASVTSNGEVVTENVFKAEKIDFSKNKIIDISIFSKYPGDLKWLDLSENSIYDITPLDKYNFNGNSGKILYLENQDITFGLYNKTINVNHYIILPTIFTYSKKEGTFAYDQNTTFEYSDGVSLNKDYNEPDEYNVIIDYNKFADSNLSVTINGGVADGTVLHFKVGSTGNNKCYIESVLFKDENLYSKVNEKVRDAVEQARLSYYTNIPLLINVDVNAISMINELNLQHIASGNDTKIKDLTGLENFSALQNLYLQNNDIDTIQQLQYCRRLKILNLASNSNIKDNNMAIETLSNLNSLNLSDTGMTNIDFVNGLIQKKYDNIVVLDISDNPKLENIEGLENLTALQSLSLANDNLNDEKISKILSLSNLTTLNINSNQVENVNIVSNLESLKYLYFNNNKVEDLSPLKGKTFYDLEFTGNKVKDISPLSAHRTINNLKMDNNQIEDMSVLSRISMSNEQNLSATGQKIVRMLDANSTGEISIPLPQIFKASQESGNKIYSEAELQLTKCTLDSSKENIIIDTNTINDDVAQVEIISGKAKGSKLIVSTPLKATITYNPSNDKKTNQNVTATIHFNNDDREIKITNNDGKDTYTFEQNGEFTFEFMDKYEVEGTATAVVQNIDKEPPVIISNNQVASSDRVEVKIEVNEKINKIDGWEFVELENGYIQISKIYYENTEEDLELTDEAGNTTKLKINAKIKSISDVLTSDKLKVLEDELKIKKINLKTTVSEFKKNLVSEMEYEILDKKGNKLLDTDKVGTGCQVKMQNEKIYTIIVWGDLNGDGEISLTELARVSKIYAKKVTPSDLEQSAIDINMNGKIDLNELAAISKMYTKK